MSTYRSRVACLVVPFAGVFTGKPGQLRLKPATGGLIAQADTDGDRTPDLEIFIKGSSGFSGILDLGVKNFKL